MEKPEIANFIRDNNTQLTSLLSSLSPEEINTIPFEGSWTAGELSGHLIKSISSFIKLLNDKVEATEANFPDRVDLIKTSMLDFSKKFTSPGFIVPAKINYKKDEILVTLNSLNEDMIQSVVSLDLTKTCTLFELPGVGKITRREAAWFVVYHTHRHIHQLKNIVNKIKDQKNA